MSISFDKDQIVSSTELVRSFARYEKFVEQLEKLEELLEHVAIYNIVEQRKDSTEKEFSIKRVIKKLKPMQNIPSRRPS